MATKKAPDVQLSSDPDKDPAKPTVLDHGEETEQTKKLREAAEKLETDPLAGVPAQMRGDADPGEADDERAGAKSRVDPINPEASPEPPKGGTLPPA